MNRTWGQFLLLRGNSQDKTRLSNFRTRSYCCGEVSRGDSFKLSKDAELFKKLIENDELLPYRFLINKESGAEVFLLGVRHRNKQSAFQAAQLVNLIKPDWCVLELDQARLDTIRSSSTPYITKCEEADQQTHRKSFFTWFRFWLSFQLNKYFLHQFGMYNITEMEAALIAAEENGARVLCGDLSLTRVMKNVFYKALKNPSKTLGGLTTYFTEEPPEAYQLQKKILQKGGVVTDKETLAYINKYLPTSVSVERDCVLINSLRNKCKGKKIVGVCGMGHVEGIVKYWERLDERMEELGMTDKDLG